MVQAWWIGAAGLALAGCAGVGEVGGGDAASAGRSASATMRTAAGAPAGQASATERGGAVHVTARVEGLPPGEHGIHVHTTGRCDAPDFASAGGHWNPTASQHGLQNGQGPHAGDMPNLLVNADGRGEISFALPAGSFDGLLDADGSALMVHAGKDDQVTDPSGNSGGRIACGVFSAG